MNLVFSICIYASYYECNQNIKLWNIINNKIIFEETIATSRVRVEKIKKSSLLIYDEESGLEIYDMKSKFITKKLKENCPLNTHEISSDLKTIYCGYPVKEINIDTGKEMIYSAEKETYGELISLCEEKNLLASYIEDHLDLWNTKTKKKIQSTYISDASLTNILFTPDNKYIITSDRIGKIHIRDIKTLKKVKEFNHWSKDYECVTALAISSDGRYLASGGTTNKLINIWEIKTGKIIKVLKGHTSAIYSLDFSPDGSKLLSASGLSKELNCTDDKIKLWDIKTEKVIDEIKVDDDDDCYRAAFVNNGNSIVTWNDIMINISDYEN